MKIVIAALTAGAVLAGVAAAAGPVSAAEGYSAYEVKQRYVKKNYKKRRHGHYTYQYWADRLPVGTTSWWQQMDREGRGGRRQ
jgi:hypothetical protein